MNLILRARVHEGVANQAWSSRQAVEKPHTYAYAYTHIRIHEKPTHEEILNKQDAVMLVTATVQAVKHSADAIREKSAVITMTN